jgi:hypothetical protein
MFGKFLFWFTVMQLKIAIIIWSTNHLGIVLFSGYFVLKLLRSSTGFRSNPKAAACLVHFKEPVN